MPGEAGLSWGQQRAGIRHLKTANGRDGCPLPQERTMRKGSPVLILGIAMLTVGAIAQEIVIEPTNGRTQATHRVSRPAAVESAPREQGKAAARAGVPISATKESAKKASAEQVARLKAAPVKTKPSALSAAETNADAVETKPVPKIPARPEWAMADTRDAHSLQMEIASALARDPKLASSAIRVDVDDKSVTLEGRAAGGEEHLQAQRLAHSYAWNRKLVDHIEVVPSVSTQR